MVAAAPTLHIVIGGVGNDDKALIDREAGTSRRIKAWVAPKTVAVGDDVVVHIAGVGLYAMAKADSKPRPRSGWHNRYGVDLTGFTLIAPAVSIATLKRSLPELKWANYPRSITTPSVEVGNKLRQLIQGRKKTMLPEHLDDEFLADANLEELRAIAILSSRRRIPGKSVRAIYRARSKAVHEYVLKRADGTCEGCHNPAPFRKKSGGPYLEPHHTKRVADDGPDHPENVIGLCPNCHRRAHSSVDATAFNQRLIDMLHSRIEPRSRI